MIRGELILDEGDPFTQLNLEKSIAEIKSRNLFRDVTYEIVEGTEDNLKNIKINVEENQQERLAQELALELTVGLLQ